MKQTFITHQFPVAEWEKLDPIEQRMAALHPSIYWGSFTTISNEGTKWYIGCYIVRPFINCDAGKVYIKSVCQSSCTIKNGKFYGQMNPNAALDIIINHFPEFEFIKPIVRHMPKYVVVAILNRKVTSQEDAWKMIAKRSYHNAHWKLVRTCKLNGVSFSHLKLACRDWEAFNLDKYDNRNVLRTLLTNAIILGEKVSCQWSDTRTSNEIQRMYRKLHELEIAKLPKDPVWPEISIPADWQFVNNEVDAHSVSSFFGNCVHSCYWRHIKEHKYIVFYNLKEELCVGYQIINNGEDVIFDQIHGKCNSTVNSDVRRCTLDIIRPFAQELADYTRLLPKAKEDYPEELPY